MANHNFIRLGLVKEITQERSEEVRDSLGEGGGGGECPRQKFQCKGSAFLF